MNKHLRREQAWGKFVATYIEKDGAEYKATLRHPEPNVSEDRLWYVKLADDLFEQIDRNHLYEYEGMVGSPSFANSQLVVNHSNLWDDEIFEQIIWKTDGGCQVIYTDPVRGGDGRRQDDIFPKFFEKYRRMKKSELQERLIEVVRELGGEVDERLISRLTRKAQNYFLEILEWTMEDKKKEKNNE